MANLLKRLMADESGASATEYVILVSIVAAAVIVAGAVFSGGLSNLFSTLTSKMSSYIT